MSGLQDFITGAWEPAHIGLYGATENSNTVIEGIQSTVTAPGDHPRNKTTSELRPLIGGSKGVQQCHSGPCDIRPLHFRTSIYFKTTGGTVVYYFCLKTATKLRPFWSL